MLKGLRAVDAATIARLCGADRSLLMRVGALLNAKVAFTALALERCATDAAAKKVALDRRLKDADDLAFCALVAEHAADGSGLILAGADHEVEPGWRVVAVEDEIGNPLLAAESAAATTAAAEQSTAEAATKTREAVLELPTAGSPQQLLANLPGALRGPVEGLFAARADDQRAAALEQLRYAAPPLSVVGELMPLLLADGAELVRERAIGLLAAAGAGVAVVDLVRALQRRDDEAVDRLAESVVHLPAIQQDLVVAAAVSTAARGLASPALVRLCTRLARHLAAHPALDRLIELLLPTRLGLLDLVRSLQQHDAPRVAAILANRLGSGAEADAALIVLLARPDDVASSDDRSRLLERGIALLLAADAEPRNRMGLAAALLRLSSDPACRSVLVERLVAAAPGFGAAFDTSIYWLVAELCRDGALTGAPAQTLAESLRLLLRQAPGPHLIALLEQQLPGLIPADDQTRGLLVEPMVEATARFMGGRIDDLVSACLLSIGPAAIEPLWRIAEESPRAPLRRFALAELPALLLRLDSPAQLAACDRLLAGLTRASDGDERGLLVAGAARLATGDAGRLQRCDDALGTLGRWGIEATGQVAAAEALAPARRASLVEHLLAEVDTEVPDVPTSTQTDAATGEVTFILDDRLSIHTEDVPRLLASLLRVARSPHCGEDLRRKVVDRLCRQWREVSSWRTIWGPGNVGELARVLGAMAEHPDFPGPLRIAVCEALLPRQDQLLVARTLARAFTAGDGAYLSGLAGKAAARLIARAAEGTYADDEFEELAETLVDFLAIPHLGPDAERVRRRLADAIVPYRAHCGSRARTKIRYLMPELPLDVRERLEWAALPAPMPSGPVE